MVVSDLNPRLFVLDASAVARSILDPNSSAAQKLSLLVRRPQVKFISSKLFPFEFGNIVKFNTPSEEASRQIIEAGFRLKIDFLDFLNPDIYKTLSLAWETKQSFYDCSYLHLAILHDCLMLTCDRKFYTATSHFGHIELWE